MQRFTFILVPGIVAILIFFGIELFDRVTVDSTSEGSVVTIDYEAYSEGINTIQFDAQGNIDYTLQALRQVSFKNEITELESPLIQLYREGDTHWNITANSGKISTSVGSPDDIEQIDLSGDVELYQLDSFGNRTVLTTELLSVDPAQEILSTDVAVTMYSENHEQSAIGMQVNLDSNEYVFHRNIRGRYVAQDN